MFGRASDILWERAIDHISLGTDDSSLRLEMVKKLAKILSKSLSILEKSRLYLSLAELVCNHREFFSSLVDWFLGLVNHIGDKLLRIRFLSRAIRLYYMCGMYGRGDNLFNSVISTVGSLDVIDRISAYLYLGESMYYKDLADADSIFNLSYEMAKDIPRVFDRAYMLVKVASIYRSIFRDRDAYRISKQWFNDGISLFRDYALDKAKFLSVSLPYIYLFDDVIGTAYLDMFLSHIYTDGGITKPLVDLLEKSSGVVDTLKFYDRIERWVNRIYNRHKISDREYVLINSALINAYSKVDIYKAYGFLKCSYDVAACLDALDYIWTSHVLKNVAPLNIEFVYSLTKSLVSEAIEKRKLSNAIHILIELQDFFPKKIDEIIKYIIMPAINRTWRKTSYEELRLLAKLNSTIIDELLRMGIRGSEELVDEKEKIFRQIQIASAIYLRNQPWGREFSMYIEEEIERLTAPIKAELLARLGTLVFNYDRTFGRRLILKTMRLIESYGEKIDQGIVLKVIDCLDRIGNDPHIHQLKLYAIDLAENTKRER